jgi:hypothetical protein
MKKIRCYIRDLYHLAFVSGISFAAWKLVRHWHAGFGEKTGHDLDTSIRAAAEKLEKTAAALEKWADSGVGGNVGKGVDEVLTDTRKTLDKAIDLVQHALHLAK